MRYFLFPLVEKSGILLLPLLLFFMPLKGQIENVIVETYYISDSLDATDTIGGGLEVGSTTYRIYIDMKPGTKLLKIYGNANHPLKIFSTDVFFNNKDRDQSFGRIFSKSWLGENTAALDTWLTLGQTSKTGTKTYFGILKDQDTDGSFIGGTNNDGGSAEVPGGLLTNNVTPINIPLTIADGFDTMFTVPIDWIDYGIIDLATGKDSTIFGSLVADTQFVSYNCGLQNSGVMGVNPDSNQVLVAQLTTKGKISFELNVQVEEDDGLGGKAIVNYVANDSILLDDEKLCPYLKYPSVCGCLDPDYVEYSAAFACNITDSCKTRIVLGCMDTFACNYNPSANYNIQTLCCYPGYCQDRDLSIVCPKLTSKKEAEAFGLKLYPNPAKDQLTIQILSDGKEAIYYEVIDSFGRKVLEENVNIISNSISRQLDVSTIAKGLYMMRVVIGERITTSLFIKN